MPGPTNYRLRERRPDSDVYDVLALGAEGPVVVAWPGPKASANWRAIATSAERLLRVRAIRYVGLAVGLVAFPFWLVGAALRLWPFRPRGSKPRLIVRRHDDGKAVFTLRASSGLMYDSRRVLDAEGRPIAQFRSRSKTTVRGGFEILDLRGTEDDSEDIGDRPALGHVTPSGGLYRFCLVGDPDAGRITPHTASPEADPPGTMVREGVDHYDVEASPSLPDDPTVEILLLAAALTVAWSPDG